MRKETLDFRNILVINHGQLGDVILSLSALRSIRERFPAAKLTVFCGKSTAEIIEISGFADDKIIVDRVMLRDSGKLWSIRQIFKLIAEVRSKRFDFVIDLHSLPETNLVGFLSGAKSRLFGNRENRSLDFLSNFRPKPPKENRKSHLTDYYMSILQPLGIENSKSFVPIVPKAADREKIEGLLGLNKNEGEPLVGLFPGAGHPDRRWNLDNFRDLTVKLSNESKAKVFVFLGPEETDLQNEIEAKFPANVTIVNKLKLAEVAAAFSRLSLLIGNDTGPVHLGAVVGVPIVLLSDIRAPEVYLPLTEKLAIMRSGRIDEITVDEVFDAAKMFLDTKDYSDENKLS